MAITAKSAREVDLMLSAGQIVAEVLELLKQHVRPGVTTGELDRIASEHIKTRGGRPSFLGYEGFPGAICTSVNEQIVHGIPGKRELQAGDIITIDVGVIIGGYHADSAMTYPVGDVGEDAQRLIRATELALEAGVREAVAGNRVGDISAAIQSVIEDHGYQAVEGLTGHGVGRRLHEDPEVPNTGRAGSGARLRPGMTLAIEPIISAGSSETIVDNDEWTMSTADGSLSAHREHTVVVGTDAPLLLTALAETVV